MSSDESRADVTRVLVAQTATGLHDHIHAVIGSVVNQLSGGQLMCLQAESVGDRESIAVAFTGIVQCSSVVCVDDCHHHFMPCRAVCRALPPLTVQQKLIRADTDAARVFGASLPSPPPDLPQVQLDISGCDKAIRALGALVKPGAIDARGAASPRPAAAAGTVHIGAAGVGQGTGSAPSTPRDRAARAGTPRQLSASDVNASFSQQPSSARARSVSPTVVPARK
mgnify:CR=1 FL=1